MSAYVVFTRERVRNSEEMKTYGRKAGPTLGQHPGARVLSFYGAHETLEGPPIDGCVLIEFPSVEAAKAWYDSPAYTEARAHRFLGSDYRCFITEGV